MNTMRYITSLRARCKGIQSIISLHLFLLCGIVISTCSNSHIQAETRPQELHGIEFAEKLLTKHQTTCPLHRLSLMLATRGGQHLPQNECGALEQLLMQHDLIAQGRRSTGETMALRLFFRTINELFGTFALAYLDANLKEAEATEAGTGKTLNPTLPLHNDKPLLGTVLHTVRDRLKYNFITRYRHNIIRTLRIYLSMVINDLVPHENPKVWQNYVELLVPIACAHAMRGVMAYKKSSMSDSVGTCLLDMFGRLVMNYFFIPEGSWHYHAAAAGSFGLAVYAGEVSEEVFKKVKEHHEKTTAQLALPKKSLLPDFELQKAHAKELLGSKHHLTQAVVDTAFDNVIHLVLDEIMAGKRIEITRNTTGPNGEPTVVNVGEFTIGGLPRFLKSKIVTPDSICTCGNHDAEHTGLRGLRGKNRF